MVLMKRDSKDAPFPKPPSKKQVENYEKTRAGGPTVENFNLDITGHRQRRRWNKKGARIVANLYVKAGHICVTTDVEVVQEHVLRHIPCLVKQYKSINQDQQDPEVQAELERNVARDARNTRRNAVSRVTHT